MDKKEYQANYRREHLEERRADSRNRYKEYYQRKRNERLLAARLRGPINLKDWESVIPKETNCQVCGISITFNCATGNQKAISFDHRNGGNEEIKGSPYTWLKNRKCTEINIKVWQECNFGMLCAKCNRAIPTKNRVDWLKNVIRYMGEEAKALVGPSSLPTPNPIEGERL